MATFCYADASSLYDAHTYGKGEVVLHTLRRALGDEAFFAGLHHYLVKYRYQLVDSHDLCSAMTEGTGINLAAFFDQWVFRPGHPILDYTWHWDALEKEVVLTVGQTQATKDGTPIFDLDATVGLISGGGMTRVKVRLNQAEQVIHFKAASRPEALLLDPDHDFLREIPTLHWAAEELLPIFKYAPNAVDREESMNRILAESPPNTVVGEVAEGVRADKGHFPVLRDIKCLGELKREDLRPLFREQVTHPNFDRRAQAIQALGLLRKDETDNPILRGLINEKEPYAVVRAAVDALGNWDASGNRDIFWKATNLNSPEDSIRLVALTALAKADAEEGKVVSELSAQTTRTVMQYLSDRANGAQNSPVMVERLRRITDPKGNPAFAKFLKDIKSFVPLGCDAVETSGLEEGGERIGRACFYKLVTGLSEWYLEFFLTTDGKVASLQVWNADTWQKGLPR